MRSLFAVVLSLAAFVGVSLVAYLVALLVTDRVVLSALMAIFCGSAAATVPNATDILAWRTRRDRENGRSRRHRKRS